MESVQVGKILGDEGCLFTGQASASAEADASALVGSNLFGFNSSMAARRTPCLTLE